MKRWIAAAALAALCISGSALAQDAHWTRKADPCYHINSGCAGMTGAVPISKDAALAFEKLACPVCIQAEDAGGDVRAVARGGTIVVCFSDSWLAGAELTGVFGFSGEMRYPGLEGQRLLAHYLHGDGYNRFLESYAAGGSAEGRARVPRILASDGELIMNTRHIGGNWYIAVRPAVGFEDGWDMYWRVEGMALRMEDGALYTRFDMQTVEENRTLSLERARGTKPEERFSAGGMQIEIYRELDAVIAVIYQDGARADRLKDMRLHIPGSDGEIILSGYMDGGRGVYCCMLTEGELGLIRAGAQPVLRRVEAVAEGICRMEENGSMRYYSETTGEMLFEIPMENGADPVADDFGLILGTGIPDRMVVQRTGPDVLMDYTGRAYSVDGDVGRITPLVWSGERGVFLVESCHPGDFKPGERLWTAGLELGKRYGGEAYADWRCYLVDQDGKLIGQKDNIAFTVYENGEIHMESAAGRISVYRPFA